MQLNLMQFSSPSINKVLTYNYIPDELKCDSNIIDNINKTFLQCKYYDNLHIYFRNKCTEHHIS